MRDALGDTQTLLLLGATSDIGAAIAMELVAHRTSRVLLAARDPQACAGLTARLLAAGAEHVEVIAFDAGAGPDDHSRLVDHATTFLGEIDVTVLAFGVLGATGRDALVGPDALDVLRTNAVGVVSVLLPLAARIRVQGHGSVVLLSSVAAVRPRRTNFAYGASKAAADAFAEGLHDELRQSGGHVLVVRPGYVKTRMTAHLPPPPLSTTPETVARRTVEGLRRRQRLVYVPRVMGAVSALLRNLPADLIARLPF